MIQLYCLRFVLVTMCLRSVEAGEHAVVIEAESDKFGSFFHFVHQRGQNTSPFLISSSSLLFVAPYL